MDAYTKWSEFYTTTTVAQREETPFARLLESQGFGGKVHIDLCEDVQLDTAVPVQQYEKREDSILQPVPSTAKGLAKLLCELPDHENFLRMTGLSAMTVPVSVPVVFHHKPSVDALVAHLQDELPRSSDETFFLTNKASAYLHVQERPDIFHTEAADEGEIIFKDSFATLPADDSVAAARILPPATAACQHQRDSAFLSVLEILTGPRDFENRNDDEDGDAVFLEDNRIKPRIDFSRWLRGLQRSVYDFQGEPPAQFRMTFVTCRGGVPQLLRCLVPAGQF